MVLIHTASFRSQLYNQVNNSKIVYFYVYFFLAYSHTCMILSTGIKNVVAATYPRLLSLFV